ncbi:hypothetical protein ACFQY7_21455 [Actinomadura luteofluorescens]|uniref:hypothetical protein n=1 Tax=Actinomadura luteofluorescens TaxID=46163 RepID=UPI003632240D
MSSASDVIAPDACAVRVVDAAKVAAVSASLPDGETITELAQVFGLLSDPGRCG